ncbi:hypothetical protein DSCW_66640 [Desulfosarcina widdelii]|uniref:Uncharacterized protein n=1 Tax=Desulfosarcina widdelii TaxID=947919 RepID=A0A5K7ZQB5_9BACT|nr:hypothetical protein [Desulfosarcina widdelii]BBO79247.1 hypothetical protein DSCW_66640 [Desulfosarcina widdelii]
MDKKANDTFAFDLENRLDDFFNDALPDPEDPDSEETQAPDADLPLKELKSTILAIDWEITDDALKAFIEQVEALLERFKDDKVAHTYLKILQSLGKYIRTHKSKSHPDTIKRLMAVYSALEEAVANEGLEKDKKEKTLLAEVRKFQQLKTEIIDSKAPYPAVGQTKAVPAEDKSGMQAIIQSLEELKSMMATELTAIRESVERLRKK